MPVKRVSFCSSVKKGYGASRRTRRMTGRGKLGDALRKMNNWLRDTRAISRGASFLGQNLPGPAGSAFNAASKVASVLGFGRRFQGRGLRVAGGRMRLAAAAF